MEHQEREMIDSLFDRLRQADVGQRDREAEQHISAAVARQPAAPYYLVQAVLVQEHALNNAQARIEELERRLAAQAQPEPRRGGFLSGLFGPTASSPPPPPPPRAPYGPSHAGRTSYGPGPGHMPGPGYPPTRGFGGGGFLAGAAQTALAVAGGVLAASALSAMIEDWSAEAAPEPSSPEPAPPAAQEAPNPQEEDFPEEDFGGEETF